MNGGLCTYVDPAGLGSLVGVTFTGERRLDFAGAQNFRDLGGYSSAGGKTVRWGQVFRSDALVLEDSDFGAFERLGIRAVYDLRSERERQDTPDRLPELAHTIVHVPLVTEDSAPSLDAVLADGEVFLADVYLHMLDRSALTIGRIVANLADDARRPAVFHCAAGKDRTGLVAALLLAAVGVSEQDILEDYELTTHYRSAERVKAVLNRIQTETGVAPEVAAGILRTPKWAMQQALAEVRNRYGGIHPYLTRTCGVDDSTLQSLRNSLLV